MFEARVEFSEARMTMQSDLQENANMCPIIRSISITALFSQTQQGSFLTLTYPVRRSRFRCKFLMSPYSANRSVRSSSDASSWIFVAMTIHPSILRTATAFCVVRASADAALFAEVVRVEVGFFVSDGEDGAEVGSAAAAPAESISISVDIFSDQFYMRFCPGSVEECEREV